MNLTLDVKPAWSMCPNCKGLGKKRQRVRKSVKNCYQRELEVFEQTENKTAPPPRPKGHLSMCKTCEGSGIIAAEVFPVPQKGIYPHIAIIGAGIGGVALAVACLHRGIPFTLYERDANFDARAQGYGLTLQQASKAIKAFGIETLKDGIISTLHQVHTPEGKIVGEWGIRKWLNDSNKKENKQTNIHIARQSLRLALMKQLGDKDLVEWNHQLIDFRENDSQEVELQFNVNGETKWAKADLLVGADGIRSSVRHRLIGEEKSPLQYLDCMVILGICALKDLQHLQSPLLDAATVFQTANGNERIYVMPFDSKRVMWQLSFPIVENDAIHLKNKGSICLKDEAAKRTPWHSPIPQIIEATPPELISSYPVYDRALLKPELLKHANAVTLLGDAAHPMSPFKGQGANQALLDALSLARAINQSCGPNSNWKTKRIKNIVLNAYESEMMQRTASKVKDSAEAARFLHSEVALYPGNEPRGRCLKRAISELVQNRKKGGLEIIYE